MTVIGLSLFAQTKYVLVIEKNDGTQVRIHSSEIKEMTIDTEESHEWVDLGMPSGTMWATCNIGAEQPSDAGSYFAWGEFEEKGLYDWVSYSHCDGNAMNCHFLGNNIAGTKYDAAYVIWGDEWCLPTQEQFKELIQECTKQRITLNQKKGVLFTGPNGENVFFPEAGARWDSEINGQKQGGKYWSATLDTYYSGGAHYLSIEDDEISWNYSWHRYGGFPIRPVRK